MSADPSIAARGSVRSLIAANQPGSIGKSYTPAEYALMVEQDRRAALAAEAKRDKPLPEGRHVGSAGQGGRVHTDLITRKAL